MDKCRKFIEQLLSGAYEALDKEARQNFHNDMARIPGCADTFAKMHQTLEVVRRHEVPDPGEDYWQTFTGRIKQRLDDQQYGEARKLPWMRLLSWAAFLAGGIFIGYLLFHQPADPVITLSGTAPSAPSVISQTADLLDDSRILLLGLVHLHNDPEIIKQFDFSRQRQFSERLLQKTAGLKEALQDTPSRRVLALVEELEIILLQIAALEAQHDLQGLELIRDSVNDQSLLLKINVEKMLLEAQKEDMGHNTPAGIIEPKSQIRS